MIRYYTAAEVAHIWRRPLGTVHRLASEHHWRQVEDRRRPALYNADDVEDTMNAPTKVYITMICDRHTDPEPFVFSTAEGAIAHARQAVQDYARHPEDIEEQRIDGWLFYCRYSSEGDSVWVIEKRLDAPTG